MFPLSGSYLNSTGIQRSFDILNLNVPFKVKVWLSSPSYNPEVIQFSDADNLNSRDRRGKKRVASGGCRVVKVR